ncbi:unnamed protein product [Acanthosepion pharaonis]|uniref:DUF7041 domain-containing protein n=1 Tax=Acanthosepion pharaonis TaxID=158019 RepID=A0A812DN54_ACAPH|nr:unnamed protein product [Sepia pharaonis]
MESVKSDSPDMTAAIIPLPAYRHNAKNWFLQVESNFSMLRITSQRARFANVMQKLPSDMMDEISDVLSDLREHEPYNHLKEAILKRTERSEEDMIQAILRNVTSFSGAAISVVPYQNDHTAKPILLKLRTANGSAIDTYGERTLTLNIGMRRDFTWTFTGANVKPILGADFLPHYALAVHMNPRTLSDTTTNPRVLDSPTRRSTMVARNSSSATLLYDSRITTPIGPVYRPDEFSFVTNQPAAVPDKSPIRQSTSYHRRSTLHSFRRYNRINFP